ncbi:MAG: hypothetical protein Q9216_004350 [Gyalolechia sp. 2 TL-2023]
MALFSIRKHSLRTRDDKRTKASELTLRQSIYPLCLGFSYGLLDTLNKHFQDTLGISKGRSSGLQAAYFGAYPLASLGHANWILRHYGYKAVFIWGLCLYVCGPPRYSEIRINLAQAFNAVGTVIAPVLGSYAFFKDVGDDEASLQNVQWVYLAIACFVFLLAFVFYFSTIPEITDADMGFQVGLCGRYLERKVPKLNMDRFKRLMLAWMRSLSGNNTGPFSHIQTHRDDDPDRNHRLFHAAFAQFCYTGAQIAIAGYFINYAVEIRDGTSSATGAIYLAVAQGCFAVGRFSGAFLMKYIKPRWVFLAYLTGVIIFNSAATTQKQDTGIAMLSLTLFFESVCFPTIVALGIRGLGRHTKRGSGWIVAGVSGGAAVPPILGASADATSTATAMAVPVCFFIAAWTYSLAVNFVPAYRNPADKIGASAIGIENTHEDSERSDLDNSESGGIKVVEDAGKGTEEHREVV